jgi:hypothetical protein
LLRQTRFVCCSASDHCGGATTTHPPTSLPTQPMRSSAPAWFPFRAGGKVLACMCCSTCTPPARLPQNLPLCRSGSTWCSCAQTRRWPSRSPGSGWCTGRPPVRRRTCKRTIAPTARATQFGQHQRLEPRNLSAPTARAIPFCRHQRLEHQRLATATKLNGICTTDVSSRVSVHCTAPVGWQLP